MHLQSLALLAVTLGGVSALPKHLGKREVINDANGNVKITCSISVGDITDKLNEVCSTQGQCDTSTFELHREVVTGDVAISVDETLSVSPSGSYPSWIHNGLVDMLYASVTAIAECEDVRVVSQCEDATQICTLEPYTIEQCLVPQYWGVSFQDPDESNAAPPFIGADMSVETGDDGFCGDLTSAAGAVAGAVNGVAGGIFSLLSLACQT